MVIGLPVGSSSTLEMQGQLKKAQDCLLSNANFGNSKRDAEALGREVEVSGLGAKGARARLVELEDAVVTLNEAIGREEREAMTRELTCVRS